MKVFETNVSPFVPFPFQSHIQSDGASCNNGAIFTPSLWAAPLDFLHHSREFKTYNFDQKRHFQWNEINAHHRQSIYTIAEYELLFTNMVLHCINVDHLALLYIVQLWVGLIIILLHCSRHMVHCIAGENIRMQWNSCSSPAHREIHPPPHNAPYSHLHRPTSYYS